MLDRVLLIVLLVLLPLGLILSKTFTVQKTPDTNEVLQQITRLEELLANADNTSVTNVDETVNSSLRITRLYYATLSGTLTVEGVAAYPADVLWANMAQFTDDEEIPEIMNDNRNDSGVVEMINRAFRTKSDNTFTFTHTFEIKKGVVDIVFWQKNERLSVRYSLDDNRQLL
jgi:hypothetical protein